MKLARISIKHWLMVSQWLVTIVMAIVIGGLSMFWFRREQENRLNDFLISEAQRIKSGIEAFYEGDMTNNIMSPDDLSNYLKQLMSNRLNRAVPYKTTLVVFDWSDKILAKSNNAIDISFTPGKSKTVLATIDEKQITINTSVKKPYRMVTGILMYDNQPFGYFNLGILNEPLTDTLSVYTHTIFLFLCCIVLLFGSLGSFFIYRIFISIKSLTKTASQISETSLDLRLPVPAGHDEIHFLAVTFNRLLARLQTDFMFQEDLVNQISHQLRTPLTIMRGRSENALSMGIADECMKAVLVDNLADIDSMTSLLHTLLNLARLESRVDRVKLALIDPQKILESLVQELSPLWEEKSITFKWLIEPKRNRSGSVSSIRVLADGQYLNQAFTNILVNAYKYSPIGGELAIEIAEKSIRDEWFCSLIIANQGPPIPEESLDLIFRRFYRIKSQDDIVRQNTAGPVEAGFGLGLSICRTLIELQNGTVHAFNPPAGGAGFEVLLPLS